MGASMNRELREKWIAELRSGNYKQGKSHLKYQQDDGTYEHCCLGVLCEVAKVDGFQDEDSPYVTFDDDNAVLSSSLLQKFHLTEDEQDFLACMNDGSKTTFNGEEYDFRNENRKNFNQIADWIEQNL